MALVGSIARRYAKALLEIGVATKHAEAIAAEVDALAAAYRTSPELAEALRNPIFPLSKRRAVVDEITQRLGTSRTVRNFALLLLDRGRIVSLPDIARAYSALLDDSLGRVRVRITSARPLDAEHERRLRQALEKQTGKAVLLEKNEDASLLGGIVSQIGDIVYDGSVRTQLENLKHQLLAS